MSIEIIPIKSANILDTVIIPKYLIIHCIGYEESKALKILTKTIEEGGPGVSAHYFVPQLEKFCLNEHQKYPVYQLVPDRQWAKHAGISYWKKDSSLNQYALGIEFNLPNYANALNVEKGQGELDFMHFEEFGDQQISAGITLIKQLIIQHQIAPDHILGHSDIAPWRKDQNENIILGKTDPGPTFPWEKLARIGIGVWPKAERSRIDEINTSIRHVQELLHQVGYGLEQTGEMNLKTQYVIKAFQMHFLPHAYDGKISEQMVVALENLIDKQYKYEPMKSVTESLDHKSISIL